MTMGRASQSQFFQDEPGVNLNQISMLCLVCNFNLDVLFSHFMRDLKNMMQNFETLWNGIRCCVHVRPHIQAWQASMKEQAKQIPTFDKFL
jgi:hypothetical protein